jgi:hypothetical protein
MGKMPMLRGTGVSPVLGQTSGLAPPTPRFSAGFWSLDLCGTEKRG